VSVDAQADDSSSTPTAIGASSPTKRVRDRVAVAAFAGLWIWAVVRIAPDAARPAVALALPAGLLAGYLLADLLAGAVHWLADRCFDPETPLLGPLLIAPFRAHHDDPTSIAGHDVFEVAGNAALVSLPLAATLLALPRPDDFATALLCVTALSFSAAAVATNMFHRWAHSASPPRLARRLQRHGLILTPMRHALHHRGEHDRAYCVTSGWLNPVLDRLGLFARLERLVGRVAGETSAVSTSSHPELRSETPSR